MKILVTGAAGALGSHVAERLLKEGHEVVGIDALTPYYDPEIKKATGKILENKGVKMIYENLMDTDLSSRLEGVEVVFHFAAQPGIAEHVPFSDYLTNNIIAMHRLLEASKASNSLKLFVNISTSSIYGRIANGPETTLPAPVSHYGVTKLSAEELALSYFRRGDLPVVNLRLFSVYGERERPEKFFHKLIKAIYEDQEIPLYEGSEKHVRSYSYVGDIVSGCLSVLDKYQDLLGETFNIGTDKTNTTGEGIRIIEEIIGKKAKIKKVPPRVGDQLETGADITKAQRLLGYQPETSFAEGLKREVEWCKEFYGF